DLQVVQNIEFVGLEVSLGVVGHAVVLGPRIGDGFGGAGRIADRDRLGRVYIVARTHQPQGPYDDLGVVPGDVLLAGRVGENGIIGDPQYVVETGERVRCTPGRELFEVGLVVVALQLAVVGRLVVDGHSDRASRREGGVHFDVGLVSCPEQVLVAVVRL